MALLSDGAFAETVAAGLGPGALGKMQEQAAAELSAAASSLSARAAFEQPQQHAIDRGILGRQSSASSSSH